MQNKLVDPIQVRRALFTILLFSSFLAKAQITHPEPGQLFSTTSVPMVEISISQSSLDSLYADPESNHDYLASFSFTRDGVTEGPFDVGLRFRGDTTRFKEKKSFRIDFNEYVNGGEFMGIETMNLNAERNDPSLLRSLASFAMLRSLGVAAPRSNYVVLVINGTLEGIYLNTEVVDADFVKSRFDTNDGNLYRCRDLADLVFLGDGGEYYQFEVDTKRSYTLRTNEKWDDYEDLSLMIKTLSQADAAELPGLLEEHLNVQDYLKALAVEVVSGNWDSYGISSTNFYLYRDQKTGRFEFIPYNLENTLGISYDGTDYSQRSPYAWGQGDRPLYERLMQVDQYRSQFTTYLRSLLGYVQGDLADSLSAWQYQAAYWVAIDPHYGKDWGFAINDYNNSLNNGWGTHVGMGVNEFLSARKAFIEPLLEVGNSAPALSYVSMEQEPAVISARWSLDEDAPGASCSLYYRINEGAWTEIPASVQSTDPVTGTANYHVPLDLDGSQSSLDMYVLAQDAGGLTSQYPATYQRFIIPPQTGPLLINEFMASNATTITDEFNEFEDWVELYNNGDAALSLSDYYLSDQNGDPGKYRFPNIQLEAGGFYLVWLDDDKSQGVNHAGFKISKSGEMLRVSLGPSLGFQVVDSLTFGIQTTDVSYGRTTDGGAEWTWFPHSTPEFSNLLSAVDKDPEVETLKLYPNPLSSGAILHLSRTSSGSIYSLSGSKVMDFREADHIETDRMAPGLYILVCPEGDRLKFVIK